MQQEFLTRHEYNVNHGLLVKDIEQINKKVEKVADKMDKTIIDTEKNTAAIKSHDLAFQKFDAAMEKLTDILNRVDKETMVNSKQLEWRSIINWKTIGAVGMFITIILQMILDKWAG